MLIDELNTFAWEEELAGSAGTAKLGKAIDLGAEANQGVGYPLYLVVQMAEAAAGGTSVAFQLVTADDEELTTNPAILLTTPAITTANLTAGTLAIAVPIPKADYKRWLGVRAVEVGTFTDGTVYAFLTQDPPTWRAYPEGNS